MPDSLDELKKRLYKKDESFEKRLSAPHLTPNPEKAASFWREKSTEKMIIPPKKSFFSWPLLIIVAVVLIVVGFASFYFFTTLEAVSPEKIHIQVSAPTNLAGGEKISWQVAVTNSNKKDLDSAEIIFRYPSGAKPLNPGAKGLRERVELGRIGQDETVKATFEAFLFGEESEEKNVKLSLQYQPADSNAILFKDESFKTIISVSPVGISFDVPQALQSGQETEVKINYVSNAKSLISNLYLRAEYPKGFQYKSASARPEDDGHTWKLGNLKPGEKGSIMLKGIISGEDLEQKSFRAKVGVNDDTGGFDVYGGGFATVLIRRPLLDVQVKLNGEKILISKPGDLISASIDFKNNLPVPIENVTIELQLIGQGLDDFRVRPLNGTYLSGTKTVVWNGGFANILRRLDVGASGTFTANFSFKNPMPIKSSADKNFQIVAKASIRSGVAPQGFAGTDVAGRDEAIAKLTSSLQLVRRAFYNSSVIPNSGSMPPKVGAETTFTVVWSLANSSNDVEGVQVRAVLPPYVSWKGVVLPADSNIVFNQSSGEVVWKIGSLKSGTGFLRPALEAAFQIGFIPGIDQIGSSPDLVSEVSVFGHDTFIDQEISTAGDGVTMELPDDTKLTANQRKVSK